MNIGILLPNITKGGAERAATRISKILSKNHNVYMIVFSQEEEPAYDYAGTFIDMKCGPKKGIIGKVLENYKRSKALKRIKNKYKLDVVISFMKTPNLVNVSSKVKGCKNFVSVRNYLFEEQNLSFMARLQTLSLRKTFKKADKIISVSKEISESIRIKYKSIKGLEKKLEVLYNPYNFDEILELSNESYDLQERCNNHFVISTMGRIQHQKGFWNLIKSFYLFHKKYDSTKLVIIGQDFSEGKINSLINSFNLQNDVFLLGKQDNPFKIISKTNCYVLSSLFEGFPNALVEAMSCGVPVIAANCKSGPKEILDDNVDLEVEDVYKAKYGLIYKCFSKFEEDYSSTILEEHQILANALEMMYLDKDMRAHYQKMSVERAKVFSYEALDEALNKMLND